LAARGPRPSPGGDVRRRGGTRRAEHSSLGGKPVVPICLTRSFCPKACFPLTEINAGGPGREHTADASMKQPTEKAAPNPPGGRAAFFLSATDCTPKWPAARRGLRTGEHRAPVDQRHHLDPAPFPSLLFVRLKKTPVFPSLSSAAEQLSRMPDICRRDAAPRRPVCDEPATDVAGMPQPPAFWFVA